MTLSLITSPDEIHARAAWSIITEPGDGVAGDVVGSLGHVAALAALTGNGAKAALGDIIPDADAALARWLPRLRDRLITDALRAADELGAQLVDPAGVDGLTELGPHIPHVLWVRGDVDALRASRRLAVIGARAATDYGCSQSRALAADIADAGVAVHSGGAYGIDKEAHAGALSRGGGTVCWLPGGIDRFYPIGNAGLFRHIEEAPGSALVSEVAPGAAPTKWRLLSRNRLIAAATQATVVVEASVRSGSIHTAGHAATLGRGLGAMPGPVTSAASAGCHLLIREHSAQLVSTCEEALALLP